MTHLLTQFEMSHSGSVLRTTYAFKVSATIRILDIQTLIICFGVCCPLFALLVRILQKKYSDRLALNAQKIKDE